MIEARESADNAIDGSGQAIPGEGKVLKGIWKKVDSAGEQVVAEIESDQIRRRKGRNRPGEAVMADNDVGETGASAKKRWNGAGE